VARLRVPTNARGLLRGDVRREATYALGSLGVGLLGSVVVTFGLIWSVAFAPIGLGFALFLAVAAFCRRVASWEGRRASALVGASWCPAMPPQAEANWFERLVRSLRSKRTYAELALTALGGPTAIVGVVVVLGSWFLAVRAVLEVVFIFAWPSAFDDAWGGSPLGALLVHTLPGVVAWLVGPIAIRQTNRMRSFAVLVLSTVRDRPQPDQPRSVSGIG
jgi:heme A synthase